jgi:hypothetical protein
MGAFVKKYVLFIIAGLLFIMCIIHAAVMFKQSVGGWETKTLVFPGTTELHLLPGEYNIFYEYNQNKKELDIGIVDMHMELTLQLNSENVMVEIDRMGQGQGARIKSDSSTTYTINDRTARSLYRFKVEEEGDYRIQTSKAGNISEQEFAITVLEAFDKPMFNMFKLIALYVFAIIICSITGLLIHLQKIKKQA